MRQRGAGPCLSCLEPTSSEHGYHPSCLVGLFGTSSPPIVDVDLARLHTLALAMVGRTSISGIQRKISMRLSADRTTLQVAIEGGRFLLKPQAGTYPNLPENEHVTTQIARRAGIEIPPCALFRLKDGSVAYLVVRFDRLPQGGKLRQEDFCQLADKSPKEKYDGSAELCARIVRRFASEPGVALVELFRRNVFAWWTGNGDMHLKNYSLLAGADGRHRLSPAYDQICTRLVIRGDQLALPVGGKRDRLSRKAWLSHAAYCGLAARAAERVLAEIVGALPDGLAVIERSLLDAAMRSEYAALLTERARLLAGGGRR
ncbi:MAG: HipA domain-containing protein [Deltaproteobacteria bacterium]|nr:HipA domain-containing protein [Deltaproteobacteria bacterium]